VAISHHQSEVFVNYERFGELDVWEIFSSKPSHLMGN